MSLGIVGMGWVTPLGSGVSAVWERLLRGDQASAEMISSPRQAHPYPVFRVPAEAIAHAPAYPRLRRSSAISRFAAVAGLAALEDAQLKLDSESAQRTALVFAVSNGGVIYTKRFYHEVVESGAQAASPLLFPETVFNAPASHLAAILGITGASYTLVGDGAVGVLALKMAEDLMQNPALDRCLVVAAEEADWLLCDAYCRWRLLRNAPPIEVFAANLRGMILSEGAGAVLLESEGRASARPGHASEGRASARPGHASEGRASARPGHAEACPSGKAVVIEQVDSGGNFRRQKEAAARLGEVFARLGVKDEDLIIASANGTFVDAAEKEAVLRQSPRATVYAPKVSLGESVGASSLWQVICAAQALRTGKLPTSSQVADESETRFSREPLENLGMRRAIVSACGLNQQVAGMSLKLS